MTVFGRKECKTCYYSGHSHPVYVIPAKAGIHSLDPRLRGDDIDEDSKIPEKLRKSYGQINRKDH
jgi:hypothetical protein